MKTHNIPFSILKKNTLNYAKSTLNYAKSTAMGFSQGTQE